MQLTDFKTSDRFLRECLDENNEFRAKWESTALARAFAKWLCAYRATHGLSQVQLSRQLGVSQATVSRWEMAENNPAFETLRHISKVLGEEIVVSITPPNRKPSFVSQTTDTVGLYVSAV